MLRLFFFTVAIMTAGATNLPAATINVPTDALTIQAAIDAAGAGDEILLADGVYAGTGNVNVQIHAKALTIRATGAPGACTIDLQLQPLTRAFDIIDPPAPGVVLDGVRIIRGQMNGRDAPLDRGGAVRIVGGALEVRDCIFEKNIAAAGGAIHATGVDLTVKDCTFIDNDTPPNSGWIGGGAIHAGDGAMLIQASSFERCDSSYGGAINCQTDEPVEIDGCTFTANAGDRRGGAVACRSNGDLIVRDSIFEDNSSDGLDGNGGGLYATARTRLERCRFIGNSASEGGGGAMINTSEPCTIGWCVFESNVCPTRDDDDDHGGGGLFVRHGSGSIHHCVFRQNDSPVGDGLYTRTGDVAVTNCTFYLNHLRVGFSSGSAIVRNCIFADATAVTGPSISVTHSALPAGGAGNVSRGPMMVDAPNRDYRLLPGSPCIDAGTNTASALTKDITTDLDGLPRYVDIASSDDCPLAPGTCGTSPIIDMGVYEHQLVCPADVSGDGLVGFDDVLMIISAWGSSGPGDIDGDGLVGFADILILISAWGSCG